MKTTDNTYTEQTRREVVDKFPNSFLDSVIVETTIKEVDANYTMKIVEIETDNYRTKIYCSDIQYPLGMFEHKANRYEIYGELQVTETSFWTKKQTGFSYKLNWYDASCFWSERLPKEVVMGLIYAGFDACEELES